MKFDSVIAGGGSAGATLAARLSEDPDISVCLLEAGGKGDGLVVRMPAGAVAMLPGYGKINNWAFNTVPQAGLKGRRGYQPWGRTLSLGVPTIWMGLLAALRGGVGSAATMKRTVVGGSAPPPSMIAAFRDEFEIDLIHGWGMTETSPLGAINQLKAKHMGLDPAAQNEIRVAQGRAPFGVDLRIVDDNGVALAHDGVTTGELHVRGHWVVDSYFGQPDNALTADGWFDTGDIATIDADGFMSIKDRSKDVIKSGGEWISSVDLENIAIAHPGIANAAAIAAAHEKWAERPVIVAVKSGDQDLSEQDLLNWFDGKIPDWQKPDAVVFVDDLPLGGTGKVFKTKLREEFGDVLIGKARA